MSDADFISSIADMSQLNYCQKNHQHNSLPTVSE